MSHRRANSFNKYKNKKSPNKAQFLSKNLNSSNSSGAVPVLQVKLYKQPYQKQLETSKQSIKLSNQNYMNRTNMSIEDQSFERKPQAKLGSILNR